MKERGGDCMALNYEVEARKIQEQITRSMIGVNERYGVPMEQRMAAAFVMAGAWIGVTGKRIRRSKDINERKELINEFNEQRRTIEDALRGIEAGLEECPGIRRAANMP